MLLLTDPSLVILLILAAVMGFLAVSDFELKIEDADNDEEIVQENSFKVHRFASKKAAKANSGATATSAM